MEVDEKPTEDYKLYWRTGKADSRTSRSHLSCPDTQGAISKAWIGWSSACFRCSLEMEPNLFVMPSSLQKKSLRASFSLTKLMQLVQSDLIVK
ncbi:hypothetical protein MLD38_040560 [Melastoma candidum]|nr:hypothetical protein MLD38_040560 [Melastoma candidum]